MPGSSHESCVPIVSTQQHAMEEEVARGEEERLLEKINGSLPIRWPSMGEKDHWGSLESSVIGHLHVNLPWAAHLDLLQNAEAKKFVGCIQTRSGPEGEEEEYEGGQNGSCA